MSFCSVSSSTKNHYFIIFLFLTGKIKYSFMKSTKPYLYTVLSIIYLPSSKSFRISFFKKEEIIYTFQEKK